MFQKKKTKNFKTLEEREQEETMIYLASDLHIIKYDKGGYTYFNKEAIDRVHEWPELTEQDQLIYLGDLMDSEVDPYNNSYEIFVWNIIRNKIKKGRNIFIRGNNDTLQDSFYHDLGFEKIAFSTICNIRSRKILLSHTSVNLTGYEEMIDYNIHGHIHRPNTDPDIIPYYHYCKRNINLCTKELRQYELTPISEINLVIESTRNIVYDDTNKEKPGMSQFIQNQVYSYLNNKRV